MMTDTPESVTLVPIDRIEVLNSRDRNMKVFEEIVENIRSIGLKKPITVTEREGADGAPAYLLVCSEGRLNAFRLLGESHIPALVVNVTDEDAFIMSLAENIARRGHRPLEILADIELLLARDYKAVELLQDHQFTPDVTRHLRKMKAARQIEAVELMIAANTITVAHADALLKATPPEQRTDYKPPQPEQPKGDPLEQIVKLEREMSQVQEKYKHAEENYGSELLNLVVAKGYLKKLMENEAVRSYVARHASEILEQFELVLNTVSMEEAVEQAEREEVPSATEATSHAQLAKDDSNAASALGMDGQLG